MLRTDAEEIGDVELFITHAKWKRGDYRRAVDVAVVPLVFCALRFSSYFFALIRCFRHATLFVLFILFSFSAQTNIRCNYSVTYYLSPPLAIRGEK
jgi:hypothetical protein